MSSTTTSVRASPPPGCPDPPSPGPPGMATAGYLPRDKIPDTIRTSMRLYFREMYTGGGGGVKEKKKRRKKKTSSLPVTIRPTKDTCWCPTTRSNVPFLGQGKDFVFRPLTASSHPNTHPTARRQDRDANNNLLTWTVSLRSGRKARFEMGSAVVPNKRPSRCRLIVCRCPVDLSALIARPTFSASSSTILPRGRPPAPFACLGRERSKK